MSQMRTYLRSFLLGVGLAGSLAGSSCTPMAAMRLPDAPFDARTLASVKTFVKEGKWNADKKKAFRQEMASLPVKQQAEVLTELASQINSRKIPVEELTAGGPIF